MILIQRVFWSQVETPDKLARLLRFLKRHDSICAGISFFTETDGRDWRYLPPEEVVKRAEWMSEVIRQTRVAGFVPEINVLNTLGHSDDGGADAPVVPWQGIVDMTGVQARQCSCPADPAFLDYVRFKYERYARCRADRYWIDDDLRIHNHLPVKWGCFCNTCVADFSQRTGQRFDRGKLVDALAADVAVRTAWIERNGEVILNLLSACAEGVRDGHPGAEIGLMTCDVVYAGDIAVDLRRWLERLTKITGGRGWLRPGGGFWSDEQPIGMVHKAHTVANTVSNLGPDIRVTYEIENYPYTTGSKSATMTGLECLLAILTTRLDGLMFNVNDHAGNDPAGHDGWLSRLEEWRPLWDRAEQAVAGTVPVGWKPAFSAQHFQHCAEDRPLRERLAADYRGALTLQGAGIPCTGFDAGRLGALLCESAACGMDRADLVGLLDKPLIMDASSAQRYLDLGLGDRIGVRSLTAHTEGIYETFTEHPFNRGSSGFLRAATLPYFGLTSHAIQPVPAAEIFSDLNAYNGRRLGAAATLIHPAGCAPVAVLGHMPWQHILSPERMAQMRRLSEAMLGIGVPFALEGKPAARLWVRRRTDGQPWIVIVLNPGFDTADDVVIRYLQQLRGQPTLLLSTPRVELDPAESACRLRLPPWSLAVLEMPAPEAQKGARE